VIPRFKPYFDAEEITTLFDFEDNVIEKFEEKFAKLVGTKFAISFPFARSGLFSLIKSLNITKSEILIPSYTCIAVPSTIIASKNFPTFANISLTDYNVIIDDMVSQVTSNTKMVMPIHMYGYPVDVKELREKIGKDMVVIEDAALSVLTKNVGKYGDATMYSFGLFKQLYTFEGGVITTNNSEIHNKLQIYVQKNFTACKSVSIVKKILSFLSSYVVFNELFYDIFDVWSRYSRTDFYTKNFDSYEKHVPNNLLHLFSRFQAKIGLAQLKKAREINEKRKKIAEFYTKELQHLNNILLPPFIDGASYSEYTIRVPHRNLFEKNMQKKGILVNTLFSYSVPHLATFSRYANDTFTNSLVASQNVVNLPSYPSLLDKPEMLQYIVKSIKESIS
jgi:dTDP-4-amino-4,6-dideoxygalactose transaminase